MNNKLEDTKREKALEEGLKLGYDLFKHITTLSTGTLLILITFLEKLFQNPVWKFLVSVSFILLIISTISSLITMFFMAQGISTIGKLEKDEEKVVRLSFIITISAFVIGMFSFITFFLVNFNK